MTMVRKVARKNQKSNKLTIALIFSIQKLPNSKEIYIHAWLLYMIMVARLKNFIPRSWEFLKVMVLSWDLLFKRNLGTNLGNYQYSTYSKAILVFVSIAYSYFFYLLNYKIGI